MASSKQVPQWTVFEQEFKSSRQYHHPWHDVSLTVRFLSPSGKVKGVDGFWDGGSVWRVRFSPNEIGEWKYQAQSSAPEDIGLNSEERSFQCVPYIGNNPLYIHGAVSVSSNKRHLQQADGTPFFWLSDTVWNGPLKADEKSWNVYLTDRQLKGFQAIQFVTTQWIAAVADDMGHRAYSTENGFSINPEFFQRMDARVQAINQYGMLAAPVLIWDADTGKVSPSVNPGTSLPDDDLETLAKYQIARYGAYQVAWILAGDGDYSRYKTDR